MDYGYKIIDKTVDYRGFLSIETYRLQHELFAGGWSAPLVRECMERGHAVAVLPYDPRRDRVVLVEQFRIGALQSPRGPWLLEVVAGMIEAGESARQVAEREALEEAGCRILELLPIYQYMISPGGSSERISLFCARVDTADLAELAGLAEEDEDIRVTTVARTEALAMIDDGRIDSATPIIALQWLAMNYRQLQTRWRTER